MNTLSAFANPGVTTYQAKIIKPDGLPLESSSVNFKFTILDPAGTCVLYSETYSSVNMASTAGLISFSLGSGVKTYPASATTFAEVFSNITPTLSCDAGGPGTYSPSANDVRKIVMQFHDGTGWQTLPAMNINAVPYAMYATEAQKISGLPSCNPGEALSYNGVSFSCEAISGGGVTSSTIIAALGYEPVQPASVTGMTSLGNNSLPAFSGSYAVGGSNSQTGGGGSNNSLFLGFNNSIDNGGGGSNNGYVIGYNNKIYNNGSGSNETFIFGSNNTVQYSGFVIGRGVSAPANNAIVIGNGYQTLNVMNNDRVGIGTSSPVTTLDVSGGVRIGSESATCDSTLAGTLRYNGVSLEFCNGTSWGGFSGSVTSNTVITALGYTPASSSTLSSTIASLSSVSATTYSVSSTVSSLSTTVSTLSTTVSNLSASMAALTSSQWLSSGTTLSYSGGNVGVGTDNPTSGLTVSGSAYISGPMVLGNTPPSGGVLDMGPFFGASFPYKAQSIRQDTLTDFFAGGSGVTTGETLSIKLNAPTNNAGTAIGSFHHVQNIPSNTRNYGAIAGNYVLAKNDGSGNLNELYGSSVVTFQNGSGTVTSVYGLTAQSYIYNGSVTNNYGGLFGGSRYGGTLENNYGVKIENAFGTVTNNYGLYIADQTTAAASAQNYNFYSDGPYTKNFFAGYVGIGTAPTARLHLGDGTSTIAALKFTSGTLLSSPASGAIEYDGANLYFTDGTNTRRTIATGSGVTSASIATALGYTPANSATVSTLQNTITSMAASQWTASGSTINFSTGNVGIGTLNPTQALDVSGSIRTNRIYAADGAFNTPSITFANAMGTGLYNAGGYLGFSVASGLKGTMTNSHFDFSGGGAGPKINFTSGDATKPSYAFNVDSDTGMFNPNSSGGSNELGFSTAGVERLRIVSAGSVGIGTSAPVTTLHIVSNQPAAAVHPDRAGFVLEAEGTSVGGRIAAKVYSDTENPLFVAYRARGSKANPQALASGDLITAISPVGFDGSNWQTGAHVRFHTTETWNSSAIGSAISFRTVTNGTSTTLDRMRIDHNGYVGIGTTAPRQIFDVAPATGNSIIRATSTNGTTALQLYRNTAGSYTGPVLWANGTDLNFGYDSSENAGPTLMTLKTSGALGVGTLDPGGKLHVSGSIIVGAQSGSTDDNDDYVIRSNGQLHLQANQSGSSNTSYVHLVLEAGTAGSSNSSVIMQTRGSERMRVDPNGSVGIGTTTPLKTLHVSNGNTSGGGVQTAVQIGDAGTGTGPLFLTHNAPEIGGNVYYSTGGRYGGGTGKPAIIDLANGIHFITSNNAVGAAGALVGDLTERMTITAAGNVGIGTTADMLAGKPNKLNIVSSNAAGYGIGISVPNTTDSNQIIFVNPNGEVGTINTNGTATTFNTASDRRLKGNIRDLEEDKIDEIFNRLKPRQWEWKYAEGQPHGEGFIAQELAEVIPDAVTKGDADPNLKPKEQGFKLWKVDYSKLTPYLTAAIQNVRKKIEALFITTETHAREIASTQEKVQKLETENANLKQENKAIKDYLCSKDPAAPICL